MLGQVCLPTTGATDKNVCYYYYYLFIYLLLSIPTVPTIPRVIVVVVIDVITVYLNNVTIVSITVRGRSS